MWHRESLVLFLEDHNTDPVELEAARKRIALVANENGMVELRDIEFALGDAELALKYDRFCENNPSRYGNDVFVAASAKRQEYPIGSGFDAISAH